MASGTTEEFYCGTYIRGRIRWSTTAVSGGHNVEMHMDVYRTNIYNGDIAWNRQTDTLYCDGQTADWYNTTISNQRTWHELFAMTKFVGHTAAKTISIGWSTTCTASYYNGSWFGSITLEALGQKASGLTVSPGSKTWNTINVSGSISSWGIGPGPNYVALAVFPGDKSVSSWGGPRVEWTADNQGNTKSWNNKQVSVQLEGGMTFKGCMPYKVGIWANNRYEAAWMIRNQVEYTPPTQPSKIEVISDTPIDNKLTRVVLRVYTPNGSNVSGAQVKTKLWFTGTPYSQFNYTWTTAADATFISAKHNPDSTVDITMELNQNIYIGAGGIPWISASNIFYYGTNDQYNVESANNPGNMQLWAFGQQVQNYVTKQVEPPVPEYSWNDIRTILTITAKANSDFAEYMQIKVGYDDDTTPVTLWQGSTGDNPVTNNWSHSVTVSHPDHGSGQFIYIKLRSRYKNNTWVEGDVFAVPVPNPILGVARYSASSAKYIVDVVEHKSDNTVTDLWQNGQRIVKK